MKSTYLVSLLSPELPERNGRLLPCCCLQYVKDRFFMRTRKTPFRSPAPGFFSESECKGTTIPRTDKIFPRFFSRKTQLFFRTPGRGTCRGGGEKHENGGVVQKNRENGKMGVLKHHFTDNQKDCLTRAVFIVHFSSVYTSALNAFTTSHRIAKQTFREVRQAR